MKYKIILTESGKSDLLTLRSILLDVKAKHELVEREAQEATENHARWEREYETKMESVILSDDDDVDALNRLHLRVQLSPKRVRATERAAMLSAGSLNNWMRDYHNSFCNAIAPTWAKLLDELVCKMRDIFPDRADAIAHARSSAPYELLSSWVRGGQGRRGIDELVRMIDIALTGELVIGDESTQEKPAEADVARLEAENEELRRLSNSAS